MTFASPGARQFAPAMSPIPPELRHSRAEIFYDTLPMTGVNGGVSSGSSASVVSSVTTQTHARWAVPRPLQADVQLDMGAGPWQKIAGLVSTTSRQPGDGLVQDRQSGSSSVMAARPTLTSGYAFVQVRPTRRRRTATPLAPDFTGEPRRAWTTGTVGG